LPKAGKPLDSLEIKKRLCTFTDIKENFDTATEAAPVDALIGLSSIN
jgi:hypothetical protein